MSAIEKYINKKGLKLKPAKAKESPASISSATKQKELLIRIATDLGYIE